MQISQRNSSVPIESNCDNNMWKKITMKMYTSHYMHIAHTAYRLQSFIVLGIYIVVAVECVFSYLFSSSVYFFRFISLTSSLQSLTVVVILLSLFRSNGTHAVNRIFA